MAATIDESLERIQEHHDRIVSGTAKVAPGQPMSFTGAESEGDVRAQGDLNLIWRESHVPPAEYVRRADQNVQLVPGETVGAKHCLESLAGVQIFDPPGWGPDYEGLAGPFLVVESEARIVHPTHGAMTLLAGSAIECRYQRNLDEETQRERRALD